MSPLLVWTKGSSYHDVETFFLIMNKIETLFLGSVCDVPNFKPNVKLRTNVFWMPFSLEPILIRNDTFFLEKKSNTIWHGSKGMHTFGKGSIYISFLPSMFARKTNYGKTHGRHKSERPLKYLYPLYICCEHFSKRLNKSQYIEFNIIIIGCNSYVWCCSAYRNISYTLTPNHLRNWSFG